MVRGFSSSSLRGTQPPRVNKFADGERDLITLGSARNSPRAAPPPVAEVGCREQVQTRSPAQGFGLITACAVLLANSILH